MRRTVTILLVVTWVWLATPTAWADAMAEADAAVTDILWNHDGAAENASYAVDARGNLDITFPRDIQDDVYIDIVDQLKAYPDINGVLAGKSGPACGAWY
ncbi:MAG TPA: hypothetical protein ENN87_08700 [Phycisphaerales bacterium]|nr:hypothetical protein [Phycisphaerales bacterium]